MKKTKRILVAMCIFSMMLCCSCHRNLETTLSDLRMFSSLEECQKMIEDAPTSAVVDVYHSPDKDTHLKELQYKDFYGCYYADETTEFTLFAYEFETAETAKEYFQNVTGRSSSDDMNFYVTGGMFHHKKTVLKGHKVYTISTYTRCSETVDELIVRHFSDVLYDDR